jgi:hypothetical protein
MSKISRYLSGAIAIATACGLFFACTSSSNPSSTSTSSTPIGATAVVDAGLIGCATFQEGCFTFDGTYAHPTVSPSCASPGGPYAGPADTHCVGVPSQTVNAASCSVVDAGPTPDDAGSEDAGPAPDAGPMSDDAGLEGLCGANGSDYGATMFGASGSDDDCKYNVSYTYAPVCENDGTYFVVTANYKTRDNAPLTGACTFAELCLNNTHAAPALDSRPPQGKQQVVEGPPGTYTVGPVQFDAPGIWTVRFHFNELCCDIADDSPHGHAAFYIDVP